MQCACRQSKGYSGTSHKHFLIRIFFGICLSVKFQLPNRYIATATSSRDLQRATHSNTGNLLFVDIRTLTLAHLQFAYSFFLLLYRKILLEEQRVRDLPSPLTSRPSTPCSREQSSALTPSIVIRSSYQTQTPSALLITPSPACSVLRRSTQSRRRTR